MTSELANFAARLREFISASIPVIADATQSTSEFQNGNGPLRLGGCEQDFNALARELFGLQFNANTAYRTHCEARRASPRTVRHWTRIPTVPTTAFKEFEMTCLPPAQRSRVFHSSGTTEQRPSRHFHNAESLAVYEASLWPWFSAQVLPDLRFTRCGLRIAVLTPPPAQAPHSSLIHMFETVRRELGQGERDYVGRIESDGTWSLDSNAAHDVLRVASGSNTPLVLLGTAFSFVHLLDGLAAQNLRFQLPSGSRVMETGGYKSRSRELHKGALHGLISHRLGVPPAHLVCEYGMSELSSQAYDKVAGDKWQVTRAPEVESCHLSRGTCHFHFPPWARAQIISPESGLEVGEGETGLVRVFDLANVFSVLAVQTEDLGVRRGDGFELLGRAALAEARGCSLMAVTS